MAIQIITSMAIQIITSMAIQIITSMAIQIITSGHPNNYIYEIFPTQAEVPNFVSKEKTQVNSINGCTVINKKIHMPSVQKRN
jgi:hypothetical protein